MDAQNNITVSKGLSEQDRHPAAEIYYHAFRRKFQPFLGNQVHFISILEKSFNPVRAIVARRGGECVGLAGVQHDGQELLGFTHSIFVSEFGWIFGTIRYLSLGLFEQSTDKGELLLEGIAVHPSCRGQGIGTKLLEAVFDYAREKGIDSVKLEVIDTNPAAQKLYERMGFAIIETNHYPYLRNWLGFSASTTMIKQIP